MRFRTFAPVLLLLIAACSHQAELPRLFEVPNAMLTADDGKPVALASMKNNVTVYDFIYTRCTTSCPLMTASMKRIVASIDKDAPVRFVSITVDPQHDTPPVLASYAATVRTDPRWTFLTGSTDQIRGLSRDGFHLAAGPPETASGEPVHSTRFAVADKNGFVREYYGGTDGDAAEHIAGTVKRLLRE